jgi:ABC-2 type transport system ATP-binding protein
LVDQADIAGLKEKMLNRVSIRFREDMPELKLSTKGIMDFAGQGISYSFLFSGEIQPLLAELVRFPIEKLTIEEPDLEEVFMHYYQDSSTQEAAV